MVRRMDVENNETFTIRPLADGRIRVKAIRLPVDTQQVLEHVAGMISMGVETVKADMSRGAAVYVVSPREGHEVAFQSAMKRMWPKQT